MKSVALSTALSRAVLLLAGLLLAACAERDETLLRVVGSSTVFPFATLVAERYGEQTGTAMIIEQTGSGGGHKLFCAKDSRVAATTSSRQRMESEAALCARHGRPDVAEIGLGYDGIVLVHAQTGPLAGLSLTRAQLWRAVAAELPGADCRIGPNPHALWSDVDPELPRVPIEVHGPPPTSGTRDSFATLALAPGAASDRCLAALQRANPDRFRRLATGLRRDGAWINAGENDDALVQTLLGRDGALGVSGYSAFLRRAAQLEAVPVEGVRPSRQTLGSTGAARYPLGRRLYLYADRDAPPAVQGFIEAFTSDAATGPDGYLTRAGLVPLPTQEGEGPR